MNTKELILLNTICSHYQIELSFFTKLNEIGLIEIQTIEESHYIQEDKINDMERMIRMHHELNINPEGIDVIFNLLQKVEQLKKDLTTTQNRLQLYES